MADEQMQWLVPSYTPDVWLTRVRNEFDYPWLGFFALLFIALFFGFLAALINPSNTYANFGIIGLFMFIFGFTEAGLTIVQEAVKMQVRFFGLVIYGKTTTLKGLGVDFTIGIMLGLSFGLPGLLTLSTTALSISSVTTPIENVFIGTLLFAVIEEFWRVSTFEPLIGNFLKGGSEIPLSLLFLGIISFFVPTFLSAPLIGVILIVAAFIIAILIEYRRSQGHESDEKTAKILRHGSMITIGVTAWVLFHVFTAAGTLNPYSLYASAFAFGFIADGVNALRQSAIPSYTAHITNNVIVISASLGYLTGSSWEIVPFVLIIFLAIFTFPLLLNRRR